MVTTLCLFTCALVAAQPGSGTEWFLRPQLVRGQELLYTGTYSEEIVGRGVQFQRGYRLENRVFVVNASANGLDLAVMTVLRTGVRRPGSGSKLEEFIPASLRLEMARADAKGKLTLSSGQAPSIPFDGPATLEGDVLVEVAQNYVTPGQTWATADGSQPPRTWRVIGADAIGGVRCVKVTCVQQSADWDQPRADRSAWRRRDTLWVLPRQGVATRVERIIEKREPARLEPTQRSVTTYDLRDTFVYPRQLYDDRAQEIREARTIAGLAEPMFREPGQYSSRAFEVLLDKIAFFMENHPETPYRGALRRIQQRLEAARRGDTAAVVVSDTGAPTTSHAIVDQPAPDFLTRYVSSQDAFHLSKLRGRCVLLIFFSPDSTTFDDVTSFGQRMQGKFGRAISVFGLTVSDEDGALKQWRDKKPGYPLLAGNGIRLTYEVTTTPKVVVIDADGIVRGAYLGWGSELAQEITAEIRAAVVAHLKH